jgi:hypothetical protein
MAGDALGAEPRDSVLRARWGSFPVSPSKIDLRLWLFPGVCPHVGGDWRVSPQTMLDRWELLTRVAAELHPPERLALHRAALTLVSELEERFPWIEYPHGPIVLLEHAFNSYFRVPWIETGIDAEVYIRDAIDLLLWRDDARQADSFAFLEGTPAEHGALIERVLADLLAELRRRGLADAKQRLLNLWASFVVAHQRYEDFVPLARAIGSSDLITTMFLVEVAADLSGGDQHSRDQLMLRIFSAADQPGEWQDSLRDRCWRDLGCDPPPCDANVRSF